MSKRIHAECSLLHNQQPQNTSIYQPALPITPAQSSNHTWKEEGHGQGDSDEVPMLPHDYRIVIEIRYIDTADPLRVLLQYHPTHMGI